MSRKRVFISIGVGVFIGLVFVSIIFYTRASLDGKFPQGTVVVGVDVSHLSVAEASPLIKKRADSFLKKQVSIKFMEGEALFSPEGLGIKLFPEETLKTIEKIDGRKLGFKSLISLFRKTKESEIPLLVTIDHQKLKTALDVEFHLTEKKPASANFYLEGGRLQIKEGKGGIEIDEDKLLQELKDSSKYLEPKNITLSFAEKNPQLKSEDLKPYEEAIKQSLNHKFVLIDPIYSDDWTVKLTDHLDWVEFKLNESNSPLSQEKKPIPIKIEIKKEKLDEFVNSKISKWLDRPADPVKIYKDTSGKVVIEGKGSNGLKVQRKQLKKAIELAVNEKIKDVPIPVTEIQPEYSISQELQDLGIKGRISTGHTSYYGSPANRVHNIKTGAAKFNGLLIAPGETFSFNKNLGPVDGSTGYRKELVIKPEGTIPEFGGGICQVSTTVYRAALLAGLSIAERNQHSYAVSYYSQIMGHGLDATIYLGGADLKFTNDTGHHILIQTYTEKDYELYVVLYGTFDGRKVEMEGPYISNQRGPGPTIYLDDPTLPVGQTKQTEKSHGGFDALWYRHLTDKDGNTKKETIKTNYKAMPAKIKVGTKAAQSTAQMPL